MKYRLTKKVTNSWKRIISMMVVCFMVFTMLPASAVAETVEVGISPFNAYVVNGQVSGGYVTGILLSGQDVVIAAEGEVEGTITVPVERILILDGGTITEGTNSGVLVNGGTFYMIDGIIYDNDAGTWGGGVHVQNGGEFTMSGGIIRDNTSVAGGGVAVREGSMFAMYGGIIETNEASARGGGVHVLTAATFYMFDGIIEYNKAGLGGGVNVDADGIFNMEGGYIRNHKDIGHGGGVNGGGTFTMTGGTIYNNTASRGGGVNMQGGGNAFSMSGNAVISNNTANVEGGGVAVFQGQFLMNDGTIEENTASGGGGVWISSSGATINGGTIDNNTATTGGGIVLQNPWSSLEINSGTISNNAATNGGGIGFLLSANPPRCFTEADFQAFLDVVTIESGVIFEHNEATDGYRVNDNLWYENPQIRPGVTTLEHALSNHDIHTPAECTCVCEGCEPCDAPCNCDCECNCECYGCVDCGECNCDCVCECEYCEVCDYPECDCICEPYVCECEYCEACEYPECDCTCEPYVCECEYCDICDYPECDCTCEPYVCECEYCDVCDYSECDCICEPYVCECEYCEACEYPECECVCCDCCVYCDCGCGEPALFTVSFNVNDGDGTMIHPTTYEKGRRVTLAPSTLTRAGHVQVGWFIDCPNYGARVADGGTFIIQRNVTLFARWVVVPGW